MKDKKKRDVQEECSVDEVDKVDEMEENTTFENEECKEQQETENNESIQEVVDDDVPSESDKLKEELEKKNAEVAEYKDKWLRAIAEMENLRKRTALEKQDSLKYANFNIITDLLTILDNFQLAIDAGKKEPFDKDSYVSGIEMIESQFIDLLFKKYGVVKYGEQGEEFDPNIHQAMMMEEGDYEKEELVSVFRNGYKLHDRVVRPAQVKVGKPISK